MKLNSKYKALTLFVAIIMTWFFPFTFTIILLLSFVSCGKPMPKASSVWAPERDYPVDSNNCRDPLDTYYYFNPIGEENACESLCANNDGQYIIYRGASKTAQRFADYYNAVIMCHNLGSDAATNQRFACEWDDVDFRSQMADSINRLNYSIIHNNKLRLLVKRLRDNTSEVVRHYDCERGYDDEKMKNARDRLLDFIRVETTSVIENTRESYVSFMKREPFFNNFDSILDKRGKSDKVFHRYITDHMDTAKSPAERHVYTIEYAHDDTLRAYNLFGAAALDDELYKCKEYSPYLAEMWRTWRASLSTWMGNSSWSYIPNLFFNRKRKQVAEIIINHIETNPTDSLAQGVLLELADIENIHRFDGPFGNGAIQEQMEMYPEWDSK